MSIKHKIKIKQQNFEENKEEIKNIKRCCPIRRTRRKRI